MAAFLQKTTHPVLLRLTKSFRSGLQVERHEPAKQNSCWPKYHCFLEWQSATIQYTSRGLLASSSPSCSDRALKYSYFYNRNCSSQMRWKLPAVWFWCLSLHQLRLLSCHLNVIIPKEFLLEQENFRVTWIHGKKGLTGCSSCRHRCLNKILQKGCSSRADKGGSKSTWNICSKDVLMWFHGAENLEPAWRAVFFYMAHAILFLAPNCRYLLRYRVQLQGVDRNAKTDARLHTEEISETQQDHSQTWYPHHWKEEGRGTKQNKTSFKCMFSRISLMLM